MDIDSNRHIAFFYLLKEDGKEAVGNISAVHNSNYVIHFRPYDCGVNGKEDDNNVSVNMHY